VFCCVRSRPASAFVVGVPVVTARTAAAGVVSPALVVPPDLCVTCMARLGRARPTIRRAVVCGPCWAAHGGSPDASEIGPTPLETVPSCDPRDQQHWVRALRRQGWVEDIRQDGRRNLLLVATLVALYASWETLESRPTWAKLAERSRLDQRSVARWLQELRVRGWLVLIERGSTPATRPMVLVHLVEGNRAAVYGLRIPLTPEEALHGAGEQLVRRLAEELDHAAQQHTTEPAASAAAPGPADTAPPACPVPPTTSTASTDPETGDPMDDTARARQRARDRANQYLSTDAAPIVFAPADRIPDQPSDQARSSAPGEQNVSPSWSFKDLPNSYVSGFSRARPRVDNSCTSAADSLGDKGKRSALRAVGLDEGKLSDWSVRVPTSEYQMLVAADWLRHRHPIFARLSRFAVRAACRPHWRARWANRDVLHAMDHRPGVFDQPPGTLISPDRVVSPNQFIRSRLRAWRTGDDAILPGYWSARVADVAAARAARRQVADRHGRAGARLLRAGETTLSADRIADAGRAARPPAAPEIRAAALATAADATATAAGRREQDAHAALLAQAHAHRAAAGRASAAAEAAQDELTPAARRALAIARAEADRATRARAGDIHGRALARARAERARRAPWLR